MPHAVERPRCKHISVEGKRMRMHTENIRRPNGCTRLLPTVLRGVIKTYLLNAEIFRVEFTIEERTRCPNVMYVTLEVLL